VKKSCLVFKKRVACGACRLDKLTKFKDRYLENKRAESATKQRHRELIFKKHARGPFLLLDTGECAQYIVEQADPKVPQIYVPNPDFRVVQKLERLNKDTELMWGKKAVLPYEGTLWNFLQEEIYESVQFSTVWFDYCCTFEGSVTCHPQSDMRVVFETRLDRSKTCTVAATFSKRNGMQLDGALKAIKGLMHDFCWRQVSLFTEEYRMMYFILLTCKSNA
jgi:hypothetical protein